MSRFARHGLLRDGRFITLLHNPTVASSSSNTGNKIARWPQFLFPGRRRGLAMSAFKRKDGPVANETEVKKPKVNGNIASFFGAPKSKDIKDASIAPAAPAVKFDKQKWVESLTASQKELLQLEIDTLDESWLAHLRDEIVRPEFLELKKFLQKETAAGKKWFPPKEDVYSWSRHTPFNNVKVVILGQDPYHNVNQAHGMAFSVRAPTPAPPSLKNMYIALKKDYPSFVAPPKNGGLLVPWADRGVLLLNTCLTVRAHEANSHANRGWERFTQRVIDLVAQKRTRGVVFMAWGSPAGKRVQKVDKQRHLVLQSVHPSPLSASRGFFDCGHFKKANAWLVSRYVDEGEIDWALTPGTSTKQPATAPVDETPAAVNAAVEKADLEVGSTTEEVSPPLRDDDLRIEAEVNSDEEEALNEALEEAERKALS